MATEYCFSCGQKFHGRAGQLFCSKRCRNQYHKKTYIILPIKKQWFDMIISGEKKEEYREIKPYWEKRFENYFHKYINFDENIDNPYIWSSEQKEIVFRNGYSENSPSCTCVCTLDEGEGKPEWGAEPGKRYYRLHIQRIL